MVYIASDIGLGGLEESTFACIAFACLHQPCMWVWRIDFGLAANSRDILVRGPQSSRCNGYSLRSAAAARTRIKDLPDFFLLTAMWCWMCQSQLFYSMFAPLSRKNTGTVFPCSFGVKCKKWAETPLLTRVSAGLKIWQDASMCLKCTAGKTHYFYLHTIFAITKLWREMWTACQTKGGLSCEFPAAHYLYFELDVILCQVLFEPSALRQFALEWLLFTLLTGFALGWTFVAVTQNHRLSGQAICGFVPRVSTWQPSANRFARAVGNVPDRTLLAMLPASTSWGNRNGTCEVGSTPINFFAERDWAWVHCGQGGQVRWYVETGDQQVKQTWVCTCL